MSQRNIYFIVAAAMVFAITSGVAAYYFSHIRRRARGEWKDLMARLIGTNRTGISLVAREMIDDCGEAMQEDEAGTGPSRLWTLIGGLEGLRVLEKNSEVLIDMACYVQQWYPEALVISEQLRLDARELRWHVARLNGAAMTGNLQISFPFYARRAILTYYLMTQRILKLYAASNSVVFLELQSAL